MIFNVCRLLAWQAVHDTLEIAVDKNRDMTVEPVGRWKALPYRRKRRLLQAKIGVLL